jgi:hypothetical protein
LALALAILVLRERSRYRPAGTKVGFNGVAIDGLALVSSRHVVDRWNLWRVNDWNVPIRARNHDSLSCAIL